MAGYVDVSYTLDEWRQRLQACLRRVVSVQSDLARAIHAEKLAASERSGDYIFPIDDDVNAIMSSAYDEISAADAAITDLTANEFRYKYDIFPGRPLAYENATLSVQLGDLQIEATAGSRPFDKIIHDAVGATGDRVTVTWVDSVGGGTYTSVRYMARNVTTDYLLLEADTGDEGLEHIDDGDFTADPATLWSFPAHIQWDVPNNWIEDDGSAATGDVKQDTSDLLKQFITGVTYRVQFDWTRTAGSFQPCIGSDLGTLVNSGANGSVDENITITDTTDLFFAITLDAFQGTITNVSVTPVLPTADTTVHVILEERYVP